jgi:hypothetical protein
VSTTLPRESTEQIKISVIDEDGVVVANSSGAQGTVKINSVKLCDKGNVLDVLARHGIQPNRAGKTSIVVEIMVVGLSRSRSLLLTRMESLLQIPLELRVPSRSTQSSCGNR